MLVDLLGITAILIAIIGSILLFKSTPTTIKLRVFISSGAFFGGLTYTFFYIYLKTLNDWYIVLLLFTFCLEALFGALCGRELMRVVKIQKEMPEELPGLEEGYLLREDFVLCGAYTKLTNRFLGALIPVLDLKIVESVVSKTVDNHPILKGCKITESGMLSIEEVIKTIENMDEKETLPKLSDVFSALNSKFIDVYSSITSPDLVKETITKIYKATKEDYKRLGRFREIVKGMPKGILEDEKLALLDKEELEEMVKERTRELEDMLIKLADARNKLEEKVKERTAELEEAKKELEKRIRDLETFQRITMDREKRVIELKKEIKELKKGLEKGEVGKG